MNPTYRRLIKIFLGSPSDLNPERQIAQRVISEFNQQFSEYWKVQVELVGWEATLPGYGRPQEIINADLDQCEHFIGMLWKWWGSKPATSGDYTSGFEEEYERSMSRKRKEGSPDITLLFKDIDDADTRDPGESLKRVLEFRQSIIARKEELYGTFQDSQQFESKFRGVITKYVQKILDAEKEEDVPQSKSEVVDSKQEAKSFEDRRPLFEKRAASFLNSIIDNENGANSISSTEVARFRLLGIVIAQTGNDATTLGTHDANILFQYRDLLDFTDQEVTGLADTGLEHCGSENVPLWYWLRPLKKNAFEHFHVRTMFGRNELRTGALNALTLLHRPIKAFDPHYDRTTVVKDILLRTDDNRVKAAGIDNLQQCGMVEDVAILEEFLKAPEASLRSNAENALISILSRENIDTAFAKLFELQSENVSGAVVTALFANPIAIRTEDLHKAALYRSTNVRIASLEVLLKRSAFDFDLAKKLLDDPKAWIRKTALRRLIDAGLTFSSDQAKTVLVKPKTSFGSLLGSTRSTDEEGDKAFQAFEGERLQTLPVNVLKDMIELENGYDWSVSMAMYDKHYKEFEAEFQSLMLDGFSRAFDLRITNTVARFGDASFAEKSADLKDFVLGGVHQQALEIFCSHNGRAGIQFVRSLLDRNLAKFSMKSVLYLAKYGDWSDVKRIALYGGRFHNNILLPTAEEDGAVDVCAQAIIKLAKGRLRDFFEMDFKAELRWRVIRKMPKNVFGAMPRDVIKEFFKSETTQIRKVAVLKCIESFTAPSVRELLADYIKSEDTRYYNVIHWLDFGSSMPSVEVRKAANTLLGKM